MNVLEKLIDIVSPKAALNRAAARERLKIINSGYGNYGANRIKKSLAGWIYHGGSSKEDIEDYVDDLRQRSRDLYYGGGIIGTGAIKTMRTNVIGVGLKLKSKIDYEALNITPEAAKGLESKIEREWRLFAQSTNCDLQRLNNFDELQMLAFMNMLLSGDVFALLPETKRPNSPYDLRIRLVEADMVTTPPEEAGNQKIINGVERNEKGEIVAYWFAKNHPLSAFPASEQKYKRILAYGEKTGRRNVLHLMQSERIGQVRGVPYLAPVIEAIKQIGRYTDCEILAAVVSGLFTAFIEKEQEGEGTAFGEAIPAEQQVDAEDDTTVELAPGAVVELAVGEKVKEVNPGRPNANFEGFVSSVCKQIGAALEIPLEILLKKFDSNFSASRGALMELWKTVKMWRSWFVTDFCQPIYEQWLAEAVAKGRINAVGFFSDPKIKAAYCSAQWIGPAQGLLNPVQEVNAAAMRVKNGFSTRARETTEMTGGDFNENVRDLVNEEKMMQEVYSLQASDGQTQGQRGQPRDG